MSETTTDPNPQIGVDNSAVIYQQGQEIKAGVDVLIDTYADVPDNVEAIGKRIVDIEKVQSELLGTLSEIGIALRTIHDDITTANKNIVSGAMVTGEARAFALAASEAGGETLDEIRQYRAWITPLLEDFRNSAVVPGINKIEGKIDELLTSHTSIKDMVENIQEMAKPLLDKLEKSPVLKMLGM